MVDEYNEKEKLLSEQCNCETLLDRCTVPCDCRGDYDQCSYTTNNRGLYKYCRTGSCCERCDGGIYKNRVNNICMGASNILSENLKYAFCVSSSLILLLIIFGTLITLAVYLKHKDQTTVIVHLHNAKCTPNASRNSLIPRAVDVSMEKSEKYSDPKRTLFYVIHQPLTRVQACNVESVLRLLPDKLVYIIEIDSKNTPKNYNEIDYITFLQKSYDNLNIVKTNKKDFFEGSLFENCWNKMDDALSTFAAKVLAIWQYGGAAMSENFLMNSRNIFDKPNDICMADKDLVYCPHECSAYVYDLMKEILTKIKSNTSSTDNNNLKKIVDNSISNICRRTTTKTGCNQVYRLQNSEICDERSSACQFIRMDKLTKMNQNNEKLKHFCPFVSHVF